MNEQEKDVIQSKKRRAKELPKPRILLLPVLMAVIILSAVLASDLPIWACIMLGIFNGALVYFLFVVLKVQRNLLDKLRRGKKKERQVYQETADYAREIVNNH